MTDHKALRLVDVLRDQRQCDEDGVMCIVSRQAVDEAVQIIESLTAAPAASEGEDGAVCPACKMPRRDAGLRPIEMCACATLTYTRPAAQVAALTDCRVPHSKYDACHNCDDPQVAATPKHDRLQGDDKVLWGVVANAGRLSSQRAYRWVHVMEAAGLGSTSAAALCVRFGFSPDDYIGGDEPDSDDEAAPTPKHDEGRDASLAIRTLARDIQHAIADDGYAPQSPADYNGMRESIIRALATQPAARRVTDADVERAFERWCDVYDHDDLSARWAAIRAALESFAQPTECAHEWVDARNQYVTSGEVCLKCHGIRAQPAEGVSRKKHDGPCWRNSDADCGC